MDRVAGSSAFAKSPRLREFLTYVAECTLEDRPLDAREQVIAERVFGRSSSNFQSGQDSIVRAEARNLRKRLETYFAEEGRSEPIIVTMPKGGYLLAFEQRPVLLEEVIAAPPVPEPVPLVLPARHRHRMQGWAIALICALSLVLTFALYQAQRKGARATLPFSALFSAGEDTLIVTSDTGLLQISTLARRRITLDEYMARTYPNVPNIEPPDLIRNWNLYEFTDSREMAIAGLIIRAHPAFASRIFLRSGHEVQLQEFKDHNAILVGSPISNPWAQLYEDRLNFIANYKSPAVSFSSIQNPSEASWSGIRAPRTSTIATPMRASSFCRKQKVRERRC